MEIVNSYFHCITGWIIIKMKAKEVTSSLTNYVTMETVYYRTDWTGVWEILKDERWEPIDDTEELQQALTEYWENNK